jgi:uncharacterized cupin superfamily protein
MAHLSHWDDAPSDTTDLGTIAATEQWLSGAVGALRLGVSRIRVPAGRASTPLHAEDEEVFYVLAGGGWSVQEDGCFEIGPGDVVYYRAWEPAHTVVAGDEGIEYIAMGTTDAPRGITRFPRLGKVLAFGHLLEGDRTHQWELESQLPRIEVKQPADERPPTIVHREHVPLARFGDAEGRWAGRHLGMHGIAVNFAVLPNGVEGAPPHCHSTEEELFVVLEGGGTLTLGDEEHEVRAGSIVGRPPATGVPHAFRGGEHGMTLLMFGDKHGSDMTYYPRTGEVRLRGLGVQFRV